MTLVDFIRLIINNIRILIAVPIALGTTIFLLTGKETKSYTSNTSIYTGFASGYTIEGNNKADFFNTAMAFDNLLNIIKARETKEEVAIRLLARHIMLENADIRYISLKSFRELDLLLSPEVKDSLRDLSSHEQTVKNIYEYKSSSDDNEIFTLLNSKHPYYSIEGVSKMKVNRVGNSDLVTAEYSSEDQSICRYTLELLTEVFIKIYKTLKEDQTNTVVEYFEKRTKKAFGQLLKAEDDLLEFRKKNNIINYYEQTRFISSKKEDLDKQYYEEEMALAAAQASMNSINNKLGSRERLILNSKEILDNRNKLSQIASQIAIKELNPKDSLDLSVSKKKEVESLRKKADDIKTNLKNIVDELYTGTTSSNGLPVKDLLTRWINNAILIDESMAKLKVLNRRRNDFEKIYKRMAPLGAEIKKIEREINVSEREYLSLLQSLNQSKLKQQNVELSSNLKVIDEPFYPTRTKASARMLFIIVGGFGGFVFTLGIVIAMEFLDSTVKYTERGEEQTELPLSGAYPKIAKKKSIVDYQYVNNRLVEQMVQDIKLDANAISKENGDPYYIAIVSNRRKEGKTILSTFMVSKLQGLNYKVLFLKPDVDYKRGEEGSTLDDTSYAIDNEFYSLRSPQELLENKKIDKDIFDFVFIELPSLLHFQYPIDFLKKIDISRFLLRSNRKWNKADRTTIDTYNNIVNHKPKLIVNGVKVETLESIIGEIPKRRGWLRSTIKRWAKFEFKSRKNF